MSNREILVKASQVGDDVFRKSQAEINADFLKRIEALESAADGEGDPETEEPEPEDGGDGN